MKNANANSTPSFKRQVPSLNSNCKQVSTQFNDVTPKRNIKGRRDDGSGDGIRKKSPLIHQMRFERFFDNHQKKRLDEKRSSYTGTDVTSMEVHELAKFYASLERNVKKDKESLSRVQQTLKGMSGNDIAFRTDPPPIVDPEDELELLDKVPLKVAKRMYGINMELKKMGRPLYMPEKISVVNPLP